MIATTEAEYQAAKARLLAMVAGRFLPPPGFEEAYNELNEELKQCPATAKKQQ